MSQNQKTRQELVDELKALKRRNETPAGEPGDPYADELEAVIQRLSTDLDGKPDTDTNTTDHAQLTNVKAGQHRTDADVASALDGQSLSLQELSVTNEITQLPSGLVDSWSSESFVTTSSTASVTSGNYTDIGDHVGPILPMEELEYGNVKAAVRLISRIKTGDSTTTPFLRPTASLDPVPELEISAKGANFDMIDSGWVLVDDMTGVSKTNPQYWRLEAKNSDGAVNTTIADSAILFGSIVP